MDLVLFRGKIYGIFQAQLFVFEETWDMFRPITKVGWDGKKYSIDDQKYKTNLFSPYYGFESQEQKDLCIKLTNETELGNAKEVNDPIEFWKWCGQETVWFRDRYCVFLNDCVEQNWKKYLSYLNARAKTLKRPPSRRVTKRLVRK